MNFEKLSERINKAHKLILEEKTGTPEEFAEKLKICRSHLYNLTNKLKEYNAPIKYSKKINSFYYSKPFDLEIKNSIRIILEENFK